MYWTVQTAIFNGISHIIQKIQKKKYAWTNTNINLWCKNVASFCHFPGPWHDASYSDRRAPRTCTDMLATKSKWGTQFRINNDIRRDKTLTKKDKISIRAGKDGQLWCGTV